MVRAWFSTFRQAFRCSAFMPALLYACLKIYLINNRLLGSSFNTSSVE